MYLTNFYEFLKGFLSNFLTNKFYYSRHTKIFTTSRHYIKADELVNQRLARGVKLFSY